MLHRDSSGQSNIHVAHAFEFANLADRVAGTGYTFTADDVNKVALQTDNGSFWVLTDDSPITWVPLFSAPFTVRVTKSGAQSINNATTTTLTWDTETWDSGSMHDTGSNTSRLVAPIAGKYLCEGTVRFQANSTGKRLVLISINGATNYAAQEQNAVPSPDETHVSVSAVVVLAANEYAELSASQNSGGALNVETALSHFSMTYLGA